MVFTDEQLLNILAFDTQHRIITIEERILIHKERARQAHGLPAREFDSPKLQELLTKTCVEIRLSGWLRPEYRYFEENGQIKIDKIN